MNRSKEIAVYNSGAAVRVMTARILVPLILQNIGEFLFICEVLKAYRVCNWTWKEK
jgi:hypothetical protein